MITAIVIVVIIAIKVLSIIVIVDSMAKTASVEYVAKMLQVVIARKIPFRVAFNLGANLEKSKSVDSK